MSKGDIRTTWKGYPDLAKAVLELHRAGWLIVKQSKHYRAYCPCSGRPADFSIAGTPKSDSYAAKKCRQDASKCPTRHDILRARKLQSPFDGRRG